MATRSLHTATMSLEPVDSVVHLAAEDANGNSRVGRQATTHQRDAWRYYDLHGEVHYPMTVGANLCSRVDLVLQKRNANGEWAIDHHRDGMAALDQVVGMGLDDFWRSVWMNTGLAGEFVLVITQRTGFYDVEVFSNVEVYQETDGRWVRTDDSGRREYLDRSARITRAWRPHPKFRRNSDSGVRSVLNECKELELLKLALLAKITSRLASVGILFLPNSLSMPNPDPEASNGTLSGDSLIQMLTALFSAPLRNPGSSAAAMPVFMRGPDDAGEKIRHIILDTSLDAVEEKHRLELRQAIAQGIELPIQTQTSISDTNHWGAWHVSESALNDHCLPVCRSGANLLTTRVLYPWLRQREMSETDVRSYRFWPDASRAALGLNRADLARQLYDRGELSGDTLRLAHGYDESVAPSDKEIVRWLGVKLNNPAMATFGMKGIPDEILSGPIPPGMGGFDAPEPIADSGQLPGNPNDGLDQS